MACDPATARMILFGGSTVGGREPVRVCLLHACIANDTLHTGWACAYTGAALPWREEDRA